MGIRFLQLIAICIVTLMSFQAYAQFNPNIDERFTTELIRKNAILEKRIRETRDPYKRDELIRKSMRLQSYFYLPEVRLQLIKKRHPSVAREIEEYNKIPYAKRREAIDKEFQRIGELGRLKPNPTKSRWPTLNEEERIEVCEGAVRRCNNDQILDCRFVIDKCRDYLPDEVYNEIDDRF